MPRCRTRPASLLAVTSRRGRVGKIGTTGESWGGAPGGVTASPCLFLLFAAGQRPGRDEIAGALEQERFGRISHDPQPGGEPADGDQPEWLELLADGLTFDLLGIVPGQALFCPPPRHAIGLVGRADPRYEAIGMAPGPHLSGLSNALPVVKTMLRLAAALLRRLDDSRAVCWHPSGVWVGREMMIALIDQWVDGGPFPALAFAELVERADGTFASAGLSFFLGREIVIGRGLAGDKPAAARLLARLADRFIEIAPPHTGGYVTLADGRRLRVTLGDGTIGVASG